MTSQTSIALASATDQRVALRSGELSSVELLETMLGRVDALDSRFNAVVTLDEAGGRRAAAAADRRRARGEQLGPLDGLPITIKDAIEVGGMLSTAGAPQLADHVPRRDAPAVGRLRAAGAVIFGKTNVPAWCADIQTSNDLFGRTNNPWDPTRTSGGSSGGAAVAVACGLTSFELGTDIGGSIRIPSHCCGTFGLKPTYGAVPQRGYLDRVGGGTLDTDINVLGPIARSAEDLALAFSVLVGPPTGDHAGWRLDLPCNDSAAPGAGRMGLWIDESTCPVDGQVRQLLVEAAKRLAGEGWSVDEDHPAVEFERQVALAQRLIGAAVSVGSEAAVGDMFGGSHRSWLLAQAERETFVSRWREWFEHHDALLCPVLGVPAFEHDLDRPFVERTVRVGQREIPHTEAIGWLTLVGVVGLPSVVVPVGRTSSGLPVGIQVVTAWYRDYRAIAIAHQLEELCGGYQVPPGI